jgi:hypothetical protein
MSTTSDHPHPAPSDDETGSISVHGRWGAGHLAATATLTPAQWSRIRNGKVVTRSVWTTHDGQRQRVSFRFNDPETGDLRVEGDEGTALFVGPLEPAHVTGATFPPQDPAATEFTVSDSGTLAMVGVESPTTRAEAYDISPASIVDAGSLAANAEGCQPLTWLLEAALDDARDAAAEEAGADADASLDSLEEWLDSLSPDRARALLQEVRAWLKECPDWVHEDDYLPRSATAQGAALEFFEDWSRDEQETVGVIIVEGEHPGSSYYAAELTQPIDAANLAAWRAGLPVWFARK